MEEQEDVVSRIRDLCALSDLSDSSILACLEARTRKDRPYVSASHLYLHVHLFELTSAKNHAYDL